MKYLSLFLLLAILKWSWTFSHHPLDVSESVHIGIQDDLKRIIEEYIQENLPSAHDLKFKRFWSEQIKEDQVKATFAYSFADQSEGSGSTQVEIEGYAILNHEKKGDEKFDYWNLDQLSILNNKIDFKEPLQINLHPNDSDQ